MVGLELFGIKSLHLVDDGHFVEGAAAALDGDVLQPLHDHWQAVLILTRVEHTAAHIADLNTHPHGLSGCSVVPAAMQLWLWKLCFYRLSCADSTTKQPCSKHQASVAS